MKELDPTHARELLTRSEQTLAALTTAAGKLDGYIEVLKAVIAKAEENRGNGTPAAQQ